MGGIDLNIISRGGEVKVNFRLVRGGGCDLILSLILPICQLPLPGNYCTVPNCHGQFISQSGGNH